jgi:hypothetical protein
MNDAMVMTEDHLMAISKVWLLAKSKESSKDSIRLHVPKEAKDSAVRPAERKDPYLLYVHIKYGHILFYVRGAYYSAIISPAHYFFALFSIVYK